MPDALALRSHTGTLATASGFVLPAVIADQGDKAAERFFTFFTDHHPQRQHAGRLLPQRHAVLRLDGEKGLSLPAIKSYHVSGLPGRTHADRQGNRPAHPPSSSTWPAYGCCSTG